MSTRATYQIKSDYSTVTLYIHHDGYEAGAAMYFYNAITFKNQSGTFAEKMIRANDRAEITESHKMHCDTEYRYNIEGKKLKAYTHGHDYDKDNKPVFKLIFDGLISEFINNNNEMIENFSYVTEELKTIESLSETITNKIEHAEAMLKAGAMGNASRGFYDCWEMVKSFKATSENNNCKDDEIVQYWTNRIQQYDACFVVSFNRVKDEKKTMAQLIDIYRKNNYK